MSRITIRNFIFFMLLLDLENFVPDFDGRTDC